ncbi:hypothetical protein SLS62_010651 [Diatrype stigma]|uniref:Fibronectin type-III domain-containing protein n=1 Tax=Diatrype stigma TaxID=117547 RepID=A0AAN9YG03_9PEZI
MSYEVITQPALGQDVQLGMLYDARTMQFFAGVSLWDNTVVNEHQELKADKLQNSHYSLSYSLQEARNNNALNIEGSLGLDLKLFSATGAAKYLNDNKSTMHEARVDVACTIVRHTRRIPQETLAHMKYQNHLDNPRYTHFVAEVVEGGSAALTFARSCSSSEEVEKLTGGMKVTIVKIPISGNANIELSEEERRFFEDVRISYSGAIAESVVNLEDALRVAREMPTKLAKQLNTLSYKLLPLSVLDNKANRLIRSLDANLIAETAEALKSGVEVTLGLKELREQEVFKKQFPGIHAQILSFCRAFSTAETEFTKAARQLLPELRDGNTDENEKVNELRDVIVLLESRASIAREYIDAKKTESSVLRTTVAALLAHGFEDHLGGYTSRSMIDGKGPRLLLSFGGSSIGKRKHPLQTALEEGSPEPEDDVDERTEGEERVDEDEGNDEEEWFENQNTVAAVRLGCNQLLQQRSLAIPNVPVIFGLASINKAYRPGKRTKSSTSVGDLILDDKGKLSIVTGKLAKEPTAPKLEVDNQTITVTWLQERAKPEQSVIPTTGFIIKYRRQPNADKDGAFPRAPEDEPFTEVLCGASETSWVLDSLSDDCDYAVAVSVQTNVGASEWSPTVVDRTAKLPSVASEMLDFFDRNKGRLPKVPTGPKAKPGDVPNVKPWDLYNPKSGKKSLFLGTTEVARRFITNGRFEGEIALRIVDVAPEFRPDIKASEVGDHDKTIVAVFTGASGHGKSTEINAFISYLLGGDLEDPARVLVIDDRGAKQYDSVTQIVTCFRIKPLTPIFEGKTLLIVDTPGFGDSRGIERDAFVTAAMSEFFKTVNHVNAVIFTLRANEARTTFLSPVSTYVFSLFAKDVRGCLRTAYTFGDAGAPLARGALQELKWPVENGEISVNNSAFNLELDGSQNDAIVRESWIYSVRGQFSIMHMLLRAAPVSTRDSSEVTRNRMMLERRCEIAEKNILHTANEAQTLIAKLNALAEAVGKAPGQRVKIENDVSVEKPVQDGNATTLCLDCNFTCHEVCAYGDDGDKINCQAMVGGHCTVCKKKCKWDRHRNAQYIIVTEKQRQWVVPEDLIKTWNKANNSLEGALLGAMDTYLELQESLRSEIIRLAELSEKLTKSALLHDPSGLINYLETLYKTAKAQGASAEHLAQLATAIKTLILVRELKGKGTKVTRDSNILLDVIGTVRKEMGRRMKLSALERADEEEKPCSLYNGLREKLPAEVRKKAPAALRGESLFSRGDRYPGNLKAVIGLIRLVLKDGGVIAALASEGGK